MNLGQLHEIKCQNFTLQQKDKTLPGECNHQWLPKCLGPKSRPKDTLWQMWLENKRVWQPQSFRADDPLNTQFQLMSTYQHRWGPTRWDADPEYR